MRPLLAFLVDDEPLALRRLARLLEQTGRVRVAGTAADPLEVPERLSRAPIDVLFLDVEMPGLSGLELAKQLGPDPPVIVFTTAYSHYALEAFEVNSVDYLLKPVEPERLEKALDKVERIRAGQETAPEIGQLLRRLGAALDAKPEYAQRLASRTGDRVEFVELDRVTHLYAEDKLTYAATPQKAFAIDRTIAELESRLDPARFVRIHRSTIVNVAHVREMLNWFGGKMLLRLKDGKTELTVARDRVKPVRERLGM